MRRHTRPPAIAAWVLLRLLRGRRSEALLGDLAEEYRRGCSRVWYWRQALWAVAADLREHPPRRFGLGALRLVMIAAVIVGAGLWPLLFVLPLDPSFWYLLHFHKHRRGRAGPPDQAPCNS